MTKPSEILLLSDCDEQTVRWARALTSDKTRLWQGTAALPSETTIDVIVTDRIVTCDEMPSSRSCSRLACGEIGIVRVGGESSADVSLRSDCTPRELRLACLLLTEVVRLRRQHNRERRVNRVLRQLAMCDPLTGLPNRRAWEDRLTAQDAPADYASGPACVAVLDLDYFKSVNVQHGYPVGDEVLRSVGCHLAENIENGMFAARLGGDEFGLLITGLDAETARRKIDQLRIDSCTGTQPAISASAGVAFREKHSPGSSQATFEAADAALRRAKSEGRNRTVVDVSLPRSDLKNC